MCAVIVSLSAGILVCRVMSPLFEARNLARQVSQNESTPSSGSRAEQETISES